jgi:multiple sugar transport system permease protein
MLSLLPIVIILLVFRVYPIAMALVRSFTNWNGLYRHDWVGIANYVTFVKEGMFWTVLRNTLILLINVPLQVFIGIVVALLLYEQVPGWRIYRAVVYTPQIISAVIIGFLFKIFFGYEGPFNAVLKAVGLGSISPRSG